MGIKQERKKILKRYKKVVRKHLEKIGVMIESVYRAILNTDIPTNEQEYESLQLLIEEYDNTRNEMEKVIDLYKKYIQEYQQEHHFEK